MGRQPFLSKPQKREKNVVQQLGIAADAVFDIHAPEAEAGAFPADTTMRVTRVWDRDTLDGIADAVTEDFVEVKKVMAVDIDGAVVEDV